MNAFAPSKVIIDLNAYRCNLAVIRGMIPKECTILAILKADAYGLGAIPLAKQAVTFGVSMLGVATVGEAMELREAGVTAPVLVLVQPPEEALNSAVEHDLRLMISDVAVAERVGDLARRANRVTPIHCKIDTGMGRQGIMPEVAVSQMLHLTRVSHVDIEGIATHFAVANSARDPFTATQLKTFRQVLRLIEKEGIPYEMVHAANSAAIVNHPASHFDMVRPGLMTFGVWPTDTAPATSPLSPVLQWESQIVLIKNVERGTSLGYLRTFTTEGPTRAAIVPVGYADGYPAALSNRSSVLIRGKRCPVRGNVSMDQIIVDVTDVQGVAIGDTVTLIGNDSGLSISVEDVARWANTIPYEILTGIGRRVDRVYVDFGVTDTYCIDGYNVIHHCARLRSIARKEFEAARDALVARVCQYCTTTGEAARIVFDGQSRHNQPEVAASDVPGVEILYSPGHQSADTVIERFVHQSPRRREVVVVTADRGIRDLCRGLGALVMSPESFLTQMDERLDQTRASLAREAERHTSNPVQDRLTNASLARLHTHSERLKRKHAR